MGEVSNYENDTTDDENYWEGRSRLNLKALEERLSWDVSHARSEQRRNSRDVDIRNNNESRDLISTGPTLIMRLGATNNLIVGGQYSEVRYEDTSESDSERLLGSLAWQHLLSQTSSLSANYQYNEVKFDESEEEYTYHRLFGTYGVKLKSSGYTISAGANRAERDFGDDTDGFFGQIQWYLTTGGHRFRVNAINQVTDSGVGLGGNGLDDGNFQPPDSNFGDIDVVERISVGVNYGYDRLCERCTIDFGVAL